MIKENNVSSMSGRRQSLPREEDAVSEIDDGIEEDGTRVDAAVIRAVGEGFENCESFGRPEERRRSKDERQKGKDRVQIFSAFHRSRAESFGGRLFEGRRELLFPTMRVGRSKTPPCHTSSCSFLPHLLCFFFSIPWQPWPLY